MSLFSDMASDVLSDLSGDCLQILVYRTAPSASWTAIPAGVSALLVPMDPLPILMDTGRETQLQPQMANGRVALNSGMPLLKSGYGGGAFKDNLGQVWSITAMVPRVSHTQYSCQRAPIVDAGPALGRV